MCVKYLYLHEIQVKVKTIAEINDSIKGTEHK